MENCEIICLDPGLVNFGVVALKFKKVKGLISYDIKYDSFNLKSSNPNDVIPVDFIKVLAAFDKMVKSTADNFHLFVETNSFRGKKNLDKILGIVIGQFTGAIVSNRIQLNQNPGFFQHEFNPLCYHKVLNLPPPKIFPAASRKYRVNRAFKTTFNINENIVNHISDAFAVSMCWVADISNEKEISQYNELINLKNLSTIFLENVQLSFDNFTKPNLPKKNL